MPINDHKKNLPFTDNAVDRLAYTVAASGNVHDDVWAVLVTSYRDDDGTHHCTGLTYGDLRRLLSAFRPSEIEPYTPTDGMCMAPNCDQYSGSDEFCAYHEENE